MESPVVKKDPDSKVFSDHVNNLMKLNSKKIVDELYIFGSKSHNLPFPRGLSEEEKYTRIVLTSENKGEWENVLKNVIVIQKLSISNCTQTIFKSYILPQLDLTLLQKLELHECKFEKDSIARLMVSRILQEVVILGPQLTIIKLNHVLSSMAFVRNVT
ncbi:hypothetical protein FO519_008551 [Halicephalobus sp. NKZ332]|nr:hypothetical protein FO519_008551 [Halicephalobus sp. NKZ332]